MTEMVRLATALSRSYVIERELGGGGMATVYLARDLKHDRDVAIKVLRPDLAAGVGAERFTREIRLVARLSHPHILPLYDSGEADGFLYFVMPAMEGASLRDRLEKEKQLPVEDAVQIAREVADALDYAHKHDVVHRDIKPENVMLHGGHAVVADFGIGRVMATAADAGGLTQTGVTVGTPAYMSPEQASGESSIDGRSDLYALGCMLYEMLTGVQPFTGPTAQAVIAKRFTQTPPQVTVSRDSVPISVSRAVAKLLATTPADRYATGAQFNAALAAALAAPSGGSAEEKSIAVLPFGSLSTNPEDEFFADGVTEEILNALAQIPGLRVAGRSSAFSFKGKNEDLRSVGTKLNVATILEGTMRRSGNRLRITAQLINASDGYQLWSERYDRVLEDVFEVQDEIATTIASRLRLSLSAERDCRSAKPPTHDLGAYELYLKGRGLLYQRGLSIPKALECFKQAVALDPLYAQAWAGLADGYTTSGYSGFRPAAEVMPQALDAARRALVLDPELAEAHNALACPTLLYELDLDLAEREFRRALELNPNYPQASAWYGLFLLQWMSGRHEEAHAVLSRHYQIDPLSGYAHVILAFSAFDTGRAAEAVKLARRGVELDPNSYLAQWCLTCALYCDGKYEEAAAEGDRGLIMAGRHAWTLSGLVSIYAAWGKTDEARALYLEMEARSAREYVQPAMLAPAAAAAGDMDRAIVVAQRALDERDPMFVMLARSWPFYDRLRTDPRFTEIVGKLKFPISH